VDEVSFGLPGARAARAPGGVVFCAGGVGIDASGGVADGAAAQAALAIENLRVTLAAAGAGLADVVSLRIFTTDIAHRAPVEAAIAAACGGTLPPSTHVQVGGFAWHELLLELEAVAASPTSSSPA
jgi:2-iminobutanoate/2-iminopropanoate deaminase